ncbi:MAG TPA: hypothetical protein PK536_08225 [Ignavibacteria bacterium]|nr:hypothetical protein [Ignavibacteria bacterium]HRJ99793.1 hypothetical protein [Ignavibacteria bacterium]
MIDIYYKFIFVTAVLISVNFVFTSHSVSQEKNNPVSSDESILRTDSKGNILGGNKKDWSYSEKNYPEILKSEKFFVRPYDTTKAPAPISNGFVYEIIGSKLVLTWFTAKGVNVKGFTVERSVLDSSDKQSDWSEIGYIKGKANAKNKNSYRFIDNNLKKGIYYYRLKMEMQGGNFEYVNLNGKVNWLNFPQTTELYPVFPNPVTDVFTIRFFLPVKDEVSLYFLNGKDTVYLIKRKDLAQGFYIMKPSKSTFKFQNEIRTLHLVRRSIIRKVYSGNVQFM